MSHGVCRPVSASVLGRTLDGPEDIARIAAEVEYNSMDLLQAAHTWSGVEMAFWDLLGRVRGEPVWRLLGSGASHRKVPYASVLFGDTPQETLQRARDSRARGR
jgi:L-alanine-DL-glutamate epimerase-like enolase superfamily enzyme